MTGKYLCVLCTVLLAGCSFSLNVTSTQPPVAVTTTTTHETGVGQPVSSSDVKPKKGVISKKRCDAFILPTYDPPKVPRFTKEELKDTKLVNVRLLQHIELVMLANKEHIRQLEESHRRHLIGCQ